MSCSIFVGNLAWAVTEQELGDAFAQHGQVNRVKIVCDRETGRPRGFGFVEMCDPQTASQAIASMNGFEIQGRQIRTDTASR